MTLDCCNSYIEQIKTTSDHCNYLASQLHEEQTKSDQLAKKVTKLHEQLIITENYAESFNNAYEDLQKALEKTESQLEKLKLEHQVVVKVNRSLKTNLINSVNQLEKLKSEHQAVVQKNESLKVDLTDLVDQLYQEHENHSTRHCCTLNQDQNQVLLSETDAQSQHSHNNVQDNEVDSITSLNAENSLRRLDEELQDSIEREEQDETLRERERRCAEQEQTLGEQEQTLAEQEKRCNECKQSLMKQEQSLMKRAQSLMKREESCKQQNWTLREQAKEDDIIKHAKGLSYPQLSPFGKRKINSSISLVPEKQHSIKRRCTSWQIKAAEYLKEELIRAWLLNPWSFWTPGEGSYRNCIRATLINHRLKDPPLERMRLVVAQLWLVWEENRRAELDKINAKSFRSGSQVKRILDEVGLRYTLHMGFVPQRR